MNEAARQMRLALRAERVKQGHLRALREEFDRTDPLNEACRLRLQVSLTEEEPSLEQLQRLIGAELARRRVETRKHGGDVCTR